MIVFILPGLVALVVIWIIIRYHQFTKAKMKVDKSWNNVRFSFKKYFSLVAEWESIVKEGTSQTSKEVTNARNIAMAVRADDVQASSHANKELEIALGDWLVILNDYPELEINQWQNKFKNAEADIEKAASHYNVLVKYYNIAIQQFPGTIFASFAGYKARELYGLNQDFQD